MRRKKTVKKNDDLVSRFEKESRTFDQRIKKSAEVNRTNYGEPRWREFGALLSENDKSKIQERIQMNLDELIQLVSDSWSGDTLQHLFDGTDPIGAFHELRYDHFRALCLGSEPDKVTETMNMSIDFIEWMSRLVSHGLDEELAATPQKALLIGLELGKLGRLLNEKLLEPKIYGSQKFINEAAKENKKRVDRSIEKDAEFAEIFESLASQNPGANTSEIFNMIISLKRGIVGWSERSTRRMYSRYKQTN